MKYLVKIHEETKNVSSDLTRYEFSTDFLHKNLHKLGTIQNYRIETKLLEIIIIKN